MKKLITFSFIAAILFSYQNCDDQQRLQKANNHSGFTSFDYAPDKGISK